MTVKTLKGNPAGKLDSLFMASVAAKNIQQQQQQQEQQQQEQHNTD